MTIEEILINDSDEFATTPIANSGPAYTFHNRPGASRATSIVIDDDDDGEESPQLFVVPPQRNTISSSPPAVPARDEDDNFDEFDSTPLKAKQPDFSPTLAPSRYFSSPKQSHSSPKRSHSSPARSQAESVATVIDNDSQDTISSEISIVEDSFAVEQCSTKPSAQFTVIEEEDLFVISSSLQTINPPPQQEVKNISLNKNQDWESAFMDSTDEDISKIDELTSKLDNSRKVATVTKSLDFSSPAAKVQDTTKLTTSAAKRSNTLPTKPVSQSSEPVKPRPQKSTKTSEEKEQEKRAREQQKDEKEREKRARVQQREEAAAEKRRRKELDQANKQKRTRQESAKEMILDVAGDLHDNEIGLKIRADLIAGGSEVKKWDKPVAGWTPLRIRRKVTAKYDAEEDIYKPCALEVTVENHALVYISGASFVEIVESNSIDKHVADIRTIFPTQKIVYIVEGLDVIVRKIEQAKNRVYANRVRQLMERSGSLNTEPAASKPTKASVETSLSPANDNTVNKASLGKLLVHFQLERGFQLIQPANGLESADWIVDLVQCISQKPYKTTKLLGDEVIDIVGIRSGKDVFDTFLKSLQQIKYVTPPVSQSISAVYPSAHHLMSKLLSRGPTAISGIQKNTTTGKRAAVGKQLAENIHKIFMSKNPDEYLDRNL